MKNEGDNNHNMITYYAKDLSAQENYGLLTQSIIPRPIGFISTISEKQISNLAPFSFFNALASYPPYFGVSVSVTRNGTLKDSANNMIATKEVVFNLVSFSFVEKMNITAKEFSPEEDEFTEAGLTPVPSELVKPFRVKEALVAMEAKVKKILWLGEEVKEIAVPLLPKYPPNNAFLFLCQVKKFYFNKKVIEPKTLTIKQSLLEAVARCGGAEYSRNNQANFFSLKRP